MDKKKLKAGHACIRDRPGGSRWRPLRCLSDSPGNRGLAAPARHLALLTGQRGDGATGAQAHDGNATTERLADTALAASGPPLLPGTFYTGHFQGASSGHAQGTSRNPAARIAASCAAFCTGLVGASAMFCADGTHQKVSRHASRAAISHISVTRAL